MKTPELLVPVGSREKFWAAIEGGADAVYLGLRNFNARERATNFSYAEVESVIKKAHNYNRKVYVTLNTVVKNTELGELLDTIYFLNEAKPDAVIVQDWGVYKLLHDFFPELVIHASTQMAVHNSTGVLFSEEKGIKRVVLARELTMNELMRIRQKTSSELEIFVHGALCYSFSGMCHFSSYLTGDGANRGKCTQPCRREYKTEAGSAFIFNLKDNIQIDRLTFFKQIGIDSLKIEGRLKSAEYVYKVTKAYRMALTEPNAVEEAKVLLERDFGREKTDYFMGGNIKNAIGLNPNTGFYVGKIQKLIRNGFVVESETEIQEGWKLRVHNLKSDEQQSITPNVIRKEANFWFVEAIGRFAINDSVFIAGTSEHKFSSKLPYPKNPVDIKMPPLMKRNILSKLNSKISSNVNAKQHIYVRIDSLDWLDKIQFENVDFIVLRLLYEDLETSSFTNPLIEKFAHKIIIELPYFIPEGRVDFYKKIMNKFAKSGYNNFMISHLSQKLLLPADAKFSCNENVYVYNDAAASVMLENGAETFAYPFEIDKTTLFSMKHISGIVPLYFLPRLFISRMPVATENDSEIKDKAKNSYTKHVRNGITYVVPDKPVSFTHYVSELKSKGFTKFIIDFTFIQASKNIPTSILHKIQYSEKMPETSEFNFNKILK